MNQTQIDRIATFPRPRGRQRAPRSVQVVGEEGGDERPREGHGPDGGAVGGGPGRADRAGGGLGGRLGGRGQHGGGRGGGDERGAEDLLHLHR